MVAPWISSRGSRQFPSGLVLPQHRSLDGSADYLVSTNKTRPIFTRLPITMMADQWVNSVPSNAKTTFGLYAIDSFGSIGYGPSFTNYQQVTLYDTGGAGSTIGTLSFRTGEWQRVGMIIYPDRVRYWLQTKTGSQQAVSTFDGVNPITECEIHKATIIAVGTAYMYNEPFRYAPIKIRDLLIYDGDYLLEVVGKSHGQYYSFPIAPPPIWDEIAPSKILYFFPLDGKNGASGNEYDLVRGHSLSPVSAPDVIADSNSAHRSVQSCYSSRSAPFVLASPSTINTKSPPTIRKSRLLTTTTTGEKVRKAAPQAPALVLKKWNVQPQGAVEIDQSNHFATGIEMLLLPTATGLYCVRTGVKWAAANGATTRPYCSNRFGAGYSVYTPQNTQNSFSYTGTAYSAMGGLSAGTFFLVMARQGANDANGVGYIRDPAGSGWGFGRSAYVNPDAANLRDFVEVNSADGSITEYVWRNGVQVGYRSEFPGFIALASGSTTWTWGCVSGSNYYDLDADLMLLGFTKRQWNQNEARVFSENPWQLFRRHTPRIYVGA